MGGILKWIKAAIAGGSDTKASDAKQETGETPGAPIVVRADRRAVEAIARGPEFSALGLRPEVLKGLTEAGFIRCTPVQEKSLPLSLAGEDVAAQAQTGTGKTAAFLIPIFEKLLAEGEKGLGRTRALIVAPTRELALQIAHDAEVLGKYTPFRLAVVYGGVSYDSQIKALESGAEIVIATPGRLIDYLKQKLVNTRDITLLVIDEADRMFDMGFIQDLRFILRRLPPYDQRQSFLFSATLSARVLELTWEYMNNPKEVILNAETLVVEEVEQSLYHVARNEKFSLLLGIMRRDDVKRVLVFANTRDQVSRIAERLKVNGYNAEALSGDVQQRQRIKILQRFKDGEIDVLCATDVASRGLHVEDVTHVFNYDVPQDPEDYVHRIGRTARAGKTGKAVTLAGEEDVYGIEPIEKLLGMTLPVAWAEEGLFAKNMAFGPRVQRPPRDGFPRRDSRGGRDGGRDSRSRGGPPPRGRGGERRPERGASGVAFAPGAALPRERISGQPSSEPEARSSRERSPRERTSARAPAPEAPAAPRSEGAPGPAGDAPKKRRRRRTGKPKTAGGGPAPAPGAGEGSE